MRDRLGPSQIAEARKDNIGRLGFSPVPNTGLYELAGTSVLVGVQPETAAYSFFTPVFPFPTDQIRAITLSQINNTPNFQVLFDRPHNDTHSYFPYNLSLAEYSLNGSGGGLAKTDRENSARTTLASLTNLPLAEQLTRMHFTQSSDHPNVWESSLSQPDGKPPQKVVGVIDPYSKTFTHFLKEVAPEGLAEQEFSADTELVGRQPSGGLILENPNGKKIYIGRDGSVVREIYKNY